MYTKNSILCTILILACPILLSAQTMLNLDEETNLVQYPGTTLSCQVNLEGPGQLEILLEGWQSTTYSELDYDRIYVYGPTMEPIGFANSTDESDPYLWRMLGNPDMLTTPINQGGTYTIALHSGENYGWPYGQTTQAYSILVSQVLVDDVFEPNDEIATASPLSFDMTYEAYQWKSVGYTNVATGDIDFYRLTLPTAGTVEIATTDWISTYRWPNDNDYVKVYDESGRRVYRGPNLANGPQSFTVSDPGDYFIELYSGDGVSMDPYEVTFGFTENPAGLNIILNVPEEYGSIQEALDLADPGDTVLVQPGTYMENISWPGTQGINLISTGGPQNTIIDGNRDFSVIEFIEMVMAGSDSTTLIQGFRITNGNAFMSGGGINIEFMQHSLTLRDVEIVDNLSEMHGGGLSAQGGAVNLENVVIANNHSMERGGGIDLVNVTLNAINLTMDGNTSDMSAAAMYVFDGNIHISQSVFHRNISEIEGTAIEHALEEWVLYPIGNLNITTSNFAGNGIAVKNTHIWTSQLEDNYWGAASGAFDPEDNPEGTGEEVMGRCDVHPWLTSENVDAPMLPPATMSIDSSGADYIAISWTPSGASDIAGYKVFYNTNQQGFPYAQVIDVGLDTTYLFENINLNSTYYIAVTAVDTDGNQSWYSEEKSAYSRAVSIENIHLIDEANLERVTHQNPTFAYDYIDVPSMSQMSYQIQVSTDNTFAEIDMWNTGLVNSSAQEIMYAGQALLDGNTYHVRVRAGENDMLSDWIGLTFRMNTAPGQPALIAPQDSIIVDSNPTLSATSTQDADEDTLFYQLLLYSDPYRNGLISSSPQYENVNDEFNWQIDTQLDENQTYYWSAGVTDTYEWTWSDELRSFTYDTRNDPPGEAYLWEPRRNAETGLTPTFEWFRADDPDPGETICSYTLYIDSPVPGLQVYDVGTNTSFTLSEPLIDNTEYYWMVVARDDQGLEQEIHSPYRRFVTNTQNEDPSVAELIAPDSVIVLTLHPELHWTPVLDHDPNDIISYEVHWWKQGEDIQDSALTAMNHTIIEQELEDNSQYNWMVISMDNSGGLSHSLETAFWTDLIPEAPVAFALLSPDDNTAGLSRTPSFLWEAARDPDPLDYVTYTAQIALDSSFTNIVLEPLELYHNGFELEAGNQLEDNTEYWWRVVAVDTDSLSTVSEVFKFTVGTVSLSSEAHLPTEYVLEQNYPNPFNPSTTIKFGLPESANVQMAIYDIRGKLITTVESGTKQAGWYEYTWNGLTDFGEPVSTGLYFSRLKVTGLTAGGAGSYTKTIKMVYLQ